jgi:nucleoid DNA-binding protein
MQRAIDKTKLKKVLLTRTAIKTNNSESLVEAVVEFAHREAIDQFKKHNRIELTGWGTFYFSEKKAKIRLKNLETMKTKIQKKMEATNLESKIMFFCSQIESIDEEIELIKSEMSNE